MDIIPDDRNSLVSKRMIIECQNYLSSCGVLEDYSLLLNKAFAEHMLETTLEESEEPYDTIDEDMQQRAVEYFSLNINEKELERVVSFDFVSGLLKYALIAPNEVIDY